MGNVCRNLIPETSWLSLLIGQCHRSWMKLVGKLVADRLGMFLNFRQGVCCRIWSKLALLKERVGSALSRLGYGEQVLTFISSLSRDALQ